MLEYPEVANISRQLKSSILKKTVCRVFPPTKPHKFCWFNGSPDDYEKRIEGKSVKDVRGFGMFVEIEFDNGQKLCINDGVNVRLILASEAPKDYQLLIEFNDGDALSFSVAMYGGIVLHDDTYDNEYYIKSKQSILPTSPEFKDHFRNLLENSKPSLSAKAFLATEQRFPGIGNGVLQDILFDAGINPKRKISTLTPDEKETLLNSTLNVLAAMAEMGGRNTEKDIFGETCGYTSILSKNTLNTPCPRCGSSIVKEAYLGGAVYYCPKCQPVPEKK